MSQEHTKHTERRGRSLCTCSDIGSDKRAAASVVLLLLRGDAPNHA